MSRRFRLALVICVLTSLPAFAGSEQPSIVELADAPNITVDWTKGSAQDVTLHGNRSFIFANGQAGRSYLLIIQQDALGSRTVAWPSQMRWPGTASPVLTTTAGKKDFLSIFYDGVNYYGLGLSQDF